MNIKTISLNIGRALLVSALFMFISLLVSIFNGMDTAFVPLLISFIITSIVGAFPSIFIKKTAVLTVKEGFISIVLSWILSFIFGMLPYILWGGEFTIINAWFESVSGYTTTGSSILTDVEALPDSLLFWRSSTHYIGGLGVVVFLMLVMPQSSPFKRKLASMEVSSLSKDRYRHNSSRMIYIIIGVYVSLTIAATVSLALCGMPLFDSINHAFSIVSTGGFSTKNLSIAHYASDAINLTVMFFMFVSALHFGLIFSVFVTRSFKPLNNPVVRFYVSATVLVSVLIMCSLKLGGVYETWEDSAMNSFFTVTSFMSTAGFSICDNTNWPIFAGILLLFISFHCGCSGSTTGGIKIDRMIIAYKAMKNEVMKRVHPSAVVQVKMDDQFMSDDSVSDVMMYIVLYIIVIIISIFLVMPSASEPMEAISGVFSSLGSVGPGIGGLGTVDSYSSQPIIAKLVYTFDMFLGRVEIYPVLIVISMMFRRKS